MNASNNEYFVRKAMDLDADTYGKLMETARAAVTTAHTADNYSDYKVNHRPAVQQWTVCTP